MAKVRLRVPVPDLEMDLELLALWPSLCSVNLVDGWPSLLIDKGGLILKAAV